MKHIALFLAMPLLLAANPVVVRYKEGLVHGFLSLRSLDDKPLAAGELTQTANGNVVTSQLVFYFADGSAQEESVVYSQGTVFRVLSYRLIQKGPAFKRRVDLTANRSKGEVIVRYNDDDGKEKETRETLDLPPDLANGILFTLMKNLPPNVSETTWSFLVATPKPRLVKLKIRADGESAVSIGGSERKAKEYAVKVEIGGLRGAVAPILGKEPPESRVWILGGKAPAFLRFEAPLFQDGPIWRVQLSSPVWNGTGK